MNSSTSLRESGIIYFIKLYHAKKRTVLNENYPITMKDCWQRELKELLYQDLKKTIWYSETKEWFLCYYRNVDILQKQDRENQWLIFLAFTTKAITLPMKIIRTVIISVLITFLLVVLWWFMLNQRPTEEISLIEKLYAQKWVLVMQKKWFTIKRDEAQKNIDELTQKISTIDSWILAEVATWTTLPTQTTIWNPAF